MEDQRLRLEVSASDQDARSYPELDRLDKSAEAKKEKRKAYLRNYQKRWMQERRLAWLKANGPCRHCGSTERLEVDHIDSSQKTSHYVWSWSDARRNEELKKCQVLCKSCHIKKTASENSKRGGVWASHPQKLDEATVIQIYLEAKAGGRPRQMGRKYGVSHSFISNIRDGKAWAWLTSTLKDGQLPLLPRDAA